MHARRHTHTHTQNISAKEEMNLILIMIWGEIIEKKYLKIMLYANVENTHFRRASMEVLVLWRLRH